jgi:hypothetical protein
LPLCDTLLLPYTRIWCFPHLSMIATTIAINASSTASSNPRSHPIVTKSFLSAPI